MIRKPVLSSNIRSIGYDPSQKHLEVEFHSGALYSYYDVEAHEHHALMNAASIGGHLHAHIKDRHRSHRHR